MLDIGWSGHGDAQVSGAGVLNGTIEAADFWNIESGLGLEWAHHVALDEGGSLTVRGRAMWQHAWAETTPQQSLALAGSGTTFDVSGPATGRGSLLLGAGLDLATSAATSVSLDYTSTLSSAETEHALGLTVGVSF